MKAKVQISVHGKKFKIGDTVTGLSKTDRKWMLEKGYLEEENTDTKEKSAEQTESKV